MSFNKPDFDDLLNSPGRTLVFMPSRSEALSLMNRIRNGKALNWAWCATPLMPFADVLEEMSNTSKSFGVLILHPNQGVGFHVQVDRVVWVGFVPCDTRDASWPTYSQCMRRGDYPHAGYTPAKWHYSEIEARTSLTKYIREGYDE